MTMTTGRLRLFAFFHLNLAYSSIEEDQRPEVIQRCYWPLLRLARTLELPVGIEASAYTLECIRSIDPGWTVEFATLCSRGLCELIGSGYVQLIGPLVPPDINAANLRLGNEAYERLLGIRPSIALVNEQAYSAGLVQHYIDTGFRAIIMEWDNPSRYHPEWSPEFRYLPQIACGQHGEEIPLIWNKSIAFQKFQRVAHGEMELEEYLPYLYGHLSESPRMFPVYGNDVEIFDFRPGRYHTEAALREIGEWERISSLFDAILKDGRFEFVLPTTTLNWMSAPGAGNRLHLESAEDPVPVKKQEKYNITRWAVTGRNDLGINSRCRRLYDVLKERSETDDEVWRELCYLWSSDFRTHITDQRWSAYLQRLDAYERRLDTGKTTATSGTSRIVEARLPAGFRSRREGRFLKLENDLVQVVLNCRRGLAIDSLVVKKISRKSLLGTLPHGYYQDISLGADYYTGHLMLETPGQPKITDLSAVEPHIGCAEEDESVIVEGGVATPLGIIRKRIRVSAEGQLGIEYKLEWEEMPPGALRLAHVTLNPEAFHHERLYFESHNGGFLPERFSVGSKRIEHGRSVSFLVSAGGAMGMTGGEFSLGDEERTVKVQTHPDQACVVAQVTFIPVAGSFFYRVSFSAAELDETCRNRPRVDFPRTFAFTVTAGQSRAINQNPSEFRASEAVAPK
jgi:Glycosyl hydrolase family 57